MRAVFIGSSNSTVGTWPETLSARQGWTCHNYSIGGGGFTQVGGSRFGSQMATAISDLSYDHAEVGFVFICDAGNDIRGTANVSSAAAGVFADAEEAYPNARIIVIPCLWGITAANIMAGRMISVMQRFQELSEAALPYRVEIVNWSWLWHFDSPAWMKPGEVHYTESGYLRVVRFVERFLRGQSTDAPLGWRMVTAQGYVDPDSAYLRARRIGNDTLLHGPVRLRQNVGMDSPLGQLPPGYGPHETAMIPVVSNDGRGLGTANVYPNGLIRSWGPLSAGTWHFNSTLPVF